MPVVQQRQLLITAFSSIKVNVSPLPIQRKIAAVLSAYDDLIENNNRRIAILERMAEELYREWFVCLRFLGYEKTKIIRGVPEGWVVKRIGEILRYSVWKNLPVEMIAIEGKYPVYGAGSIFGYYSKRNTESLTTLITCRGNGSCTVWRTIHADAFITNNSFKIKSKLLEQASDMLFLLPSKIFFC